MSEKTNLKSAKTEVVDVSQKEVKEVILNIQESAWDIDTVIHEKVKPKYPDMHIARPSQKECREGHRGWKPLKYNSVDQTVKEVQSIDDADTTQSNVLAWRKKEIQNFINKEEEKKRRESNARAHHDSTRAYEGLNTAFSAAGAEKIRAKPLTSDDE